MQIVTEHQSNVLARLAGVTSTYRDSVEVHARHTEAWQQVITEAIDAGIPNKTVARIAGVSTPRICAIVARQYGLHPDGPPSAGEPPTALVA